MSKQPYLLLLVASLFSQNVDGEFSFGEISFLMKNIHVGGNYKDRRQHSELNNGVGSFDIGLLKYGFSNIEVSGDVNADNEWAKVKYKFSGPEFELSNLKIDLSFEAPNVWDLMKEELAHERARKISSIFSEITESIGMYYKTYNEFPANIDRLLINGMLGRSSINIAVLDISGDLNRPQIKGIDLGY